MLSFTAFRARNRAVSSLRSIATSAKPYRTTRSFLRHYASTTNAPPPVTKVEKLILDSIKATGPVSFATYMQTCLAHPTHGYYMDPEHPVFGSRGDFITSPEISQVFGELVAIWFLAQWQSAGSPSAIRLVELGPGRGTLMADVVRVITNLTAKLKPGLLKEIHLVETSKALREIQIEKLAPFRGQTGCAVEWHDDLDYIPSSPAFTMVVAHEFFDALPFYLIQKINDKEWREVRVASALTPLKDPRTESTEPLSTTETVPQGEHPDPESVYPRFRRALSPDPTAASIGTAVLSPRYENLAPGSLLEVSPTSYYKARQLATLLGSSKPKPAIENTQTPESNVPPNGGGCGLIIDYGDDKAFGNSFRAFKDHKIVDVFERPGQCDLTTNVDFALLREAMGDLVSSHGPLTQREFLIRMGISFRVSNLTKTQSEERKKAIVDAAERLMDPTGMGTEYKVLGFTSFRGERGEDGKLPPVYPF
ncbi:hypothetical protein H0H81_012620 [Sphagnurus paluster]|uniref:Protein arginine methyltransferase NDUFAF7 n=1 Tax=Sphagnurus paluster TaxID=117069 RepID=A0A9P7KH73_9AGAR|nr:hypothetical protein H0H81_012620 [Sphagnurus paluster]